MRFSLNAVFLAASSLVNGLFDLEGAGHPRNGWLIIVRLQCNRTLRRWLSRLRNPNAIRAASLTSRLLASVPALVMPVSMNARICGHQASMVLASVVPR